MCVCWSLSCVSCLFLVPPYTPCLFISHLQVLFHPCILPLSLFLCFRLPPPFFFFFLSCSVSVWWEKVSVSPQKWVLVVPPRGHRLRLSTGCCSLPYRVRKSWFIVHPVFSVTPQKNVGVQNPDKLTLLLRQQGDLYRFKRPMRSSLFHHTFKYSKQIPSRETVWTPLTACLKRSFLKCFLSVGK